MGGSDFILFFFPFLVLKDPKSRMTNSLSSSFDSKYYYSSFSGDVMWVLGIEEWGGGSQTGGLDSEIVDRGGRRGCVGLAAWGPHQS